jgi:protein dithiol oxidoreductase (disulfide-forming)
VTRFMRCLLTVALLLAAAAVFAQDPGVVAEPDASPGVALPADTPVAATEPPPSQFQLNRHYRRLSPAQPTSSGADQVEVALLFSYDCAACRLLEADLTRDYPPSGRTARHRLVRMPSVAGDAGLLQARAYYTALALDLADEAHAAMYREVQDAGRALDSEDELRVLFARIGVAEQAFDDLFYSARITADVRRAADLARRYRAATTPAVIVNGRFVTTVDMAGGREAAVRLVAELFARETLRN